MTTIYERADRGADVPGTHVLIVAVGAYPHLVGGSEDLAEDPMGLAQLTSPPLSAAAIVAWCLGRERGLAAGHRNPVTPLSTIEAAASPAMLDVPGQGPTAVELADFAGIEASFERWRARCAANISNVGIFYFCGHGVMTANQYLLAADFGGANPWHKAFDLPTTVRALEREIAGPMYFFIDACRQIPRAAAAKLGANPLPLRALDLNLAARNTSRLVLYAAGEGLKAYARQNGVSRYTAALIEALSGYAGRKRAGVAEWEVTGEDIARSVRRLLEAGEAAGEPRQVVEQELAVPTVLHVDTVPAKVKVALDVAPLAARSAHRVFLRRNGATATMLAQEWPWRTDVPRGFYDVGAQSAQSQADVVLLKDEELEPPSYDHTLSVTP